MKILYLIDQVYLHGGIEKVLSQKANYLSDKLGFEVIIVTSNQNDNLPCYNFSNKIRFHDLSINYIQGKSYFHPLNLIKSIKHYLLLKKTVKKIKPNVIVSCSYSFDFYFLPYIFPEIPKIKEFHSSRYLEEKIVNKRLKEKVMAFLSKNAEKKYHHLVVLNSEEKEFYNNERISVIPNPILINDLEINVHNKKIIAAGRISPVKNFGELIDVFNDLKNYLKDWELHFYGEDYLETQKKLVEKITKFNLGEQVKFLGTTDDILKTMQDYSVYAMTSLTECFPMVLLEALSVGLPIISYNCPTGPKFIVKNNENGFLCDNKEDFKSKLLKLVQDDDLRRQFSQNAKISAEEFSEDIIIIKWVELFTNLIK